MAVYRYHVADYISTDSAGTTNVFLGAGVETLDENPNAVITESAYIPDKSKSKSTDGYAFVFPFTSTLLLEVGASDEAIKSIHDVPYLLQTGIDAERDYVRVNLYEPLEGVANTYTARQFRVSVEVSGITGAATEKMKMAGNLNGVGDPEHGWFNTETKTFTTTEPTA